MDVVPEHDSRGSRRASEDRASRPFELSRSSRQCPNYPSRLRGETGVMHTGILLPLATGIWSRDWVHLRDPHLQIGNCRRALDKLPWRTKAPDETPWG